MLGAEWYGMPDYWKNTQAYANSVFLIIFTFEAAFKIIGLGFFEYVKDGFNLFDFLIVISGFVEVIFQSGAGAALSVLRGFRILRIFKLLKKAKGLQTLVQTILRAAVDASNLGLLIILFVCINALIGKQLYSGEVIDEEGNHSRTGFEDFQTAVLTVFICMTGTWVGPMQDITRNNSSIGVIFFLEIVLFGNFLLLNLFLAILLQNIEHVMGTQREEEKEMKRSLQEKSSDSLRA
jgi:voltage-dependent calcium channel L type alpha-1D